MIFKDNKVPIYAVDMPEYAPAIFGKDEFYSTLKHLDCVQIDFCFCNSERIAELLNIFSPDKVFLEKGYIENASLIKDDMSGFILFKKTEESNGINIDLAATVHLSNDDNVGSLFCRITPDPSGDGVMVVMPKDNMDIDLGGERVSFALYSFLEMNHQALHHSDNLEELPEKIYHYKQEKRSKKGKKRTKSVIYKCRQFRINKVTDDDCMPTPHKPINRKTESWSVCGHYRHYKSGKVIFVRPHIKGKREEVKPHTYKVG